MKKWPDKKKKFIIPKKWNEEYKQILRSKKRNDENGKMTLWDQKSEMIKMQRWNL